jgi:hypothetical protein
VADHLTVEAHPNQAVRDVTGVIDVVTLDDRFF